MYIRGFNIREIALWAKYLENSVEKLRKDVDSKEVNGK
jgi:hypothetical protein